jgi:hypothetical protein
MLARGPGHSDTAESTSRTPWYRAPRELLAPLGALLLATVAVAGVYVTSLRSSPVRSVAPTTVRHALRIYSPPSLTGAFPTEPGPDRLGWQWVRDTASIGINASGPVWLAFRARSLRVSRTLTVVSPRGRKLSTQIGPTPRIYVIGPVAQGISQIRTRPASAVATVRDRRHVSVALSLLRGFTRPLAALPGDGFWPAETYSGTTFNWLSNRGVIDVYEPTTRVGAACVTFGARAIGEPRTLTARSGASVSRAAISTIPSAVRLGPFRLTHGRARVVLTTSPSARRYGTDPRLLSVQFAEVEAEPDTARVSE